MKKPKLFTKLKQVLNWLFLVFSALFLILLFVFKDTLNNYASKAIKTQASAEIQNSESAFVDSAYSYTKNGLKYEFTFLEFGAKVCTACKRMELVMQKIRSKYPESINVVFINVLFPENQRLMKYFGITAIPTQVLLNKEGKEFFRHSGYFSEKELLEKIMFK